MAERQRHGEVKITAWLPRTLWKRAKLRAAAEGRPLRLVILDALTAYLAAKEGQR
ncbi:MAG: hypothetical protein U0807_03510 [Candidatus Binatia bacterium]